MLLTTTTLTSRLMAIGPVVAQSSNTGGGGIPWIDLLIVLAGIGGVLFAVCRSANRR